jgi:hypothetical protein
MRPLELEDLPVTSTRSRCRPRICRRGLRLFYTKEEREEWLGGRERQKPDAVPGIQVSRNPGRADHLPDRASRYFRHGPLDRKVVHVPDADVALDHRMERLAEQRELAFALQTWSQLRRPRLLHETPGHLFLEHELEDLASFLQVAMWSGWGWLHLDPSGLRECILQPRRVHRFLCQTRSQPSGGRNELGISRWGRIRVPPYGRVQ